MTSVLERYAPIVDDPAAFLAAAQRPLPRIAWANPLQGATEAVARRVKERCPDAQPIAWRPHTWRLPADARPGKWPEFEMGLLHTQEEISLWPVIVLDPKPGERVLDLCASPGNKTAHIAIAMQDEGTVVANEPNVARLAPLAETINRLGLTCVMTAALDGRNFPGADGSYDRVLVDAPCSCEGTSRKTAGRMRSNPLVSRVRFSRVQRSLLLRALALVRRGGVVVYSTCTYAPEENEAILSEVPDHVAAIEPIATPASLRTAPGVETWHGMTYRSDVRHAARIWPHHNDTGGFFVALLRRL